MTNFDRTPSKTKRAQAMRKEMPAAEVILWSRIKTRQLGGLQFRRQHPIGPYYLDFYCPGARLCIELDGDQHGEISAQKRDAVRTAFLEAKGIFVLRYWNDEIYKNLNGVLDGIYYHANILRRKIEIENDSLSPPLKRGSGRRRVSAG